MGYRGGVSKPEGDFAIRPIHHKEPWRIEAHIFIAFLAYCLHVTIGLRLKGLAPGLTPRSLFEKFAAVQMIDVHIPHQQRSRTAADPLQRARTGK